VKLCEGEQPWLTEMPLSFFSKREFAYSATGADDEVFFTPEYSWPQTTAQYSTMIQTEFEVEVTAASQWIEAQQPFLLPWSGVLGEKRPFLRRTYDAEQEKTLEADKSDFAYWLPTGRADDSGPRRDVKKFLLK